MEDGFRTYPGDPWHADEDEYSVRLFKGNFQMAKMPKEHAELDIPFVCYWPTPDTIMWMLQVLNEAEQKTPSP